MAISGPVNGRVGVSVRYTPAISLTAVKVQLAETHVWMLLEGMSHDLQTPKVGTLTKNAIKTKTCSLLNHLNFYLTDKITDKTYSVFSPTNLIVGLSVKTQTNSVCCCIKKCNLKMYYAKRKTFINFVQKSCPEFSGPEVI